MANFKYQGNFSFSGPTGIRPITNLWIGSVMSLRSYTTPLLPLQLCCLVVCPAFDVFPSVYFGWQIVWWWVNIRKNIPFLHLSDWIQMLQWPCLNQSLQICTKMTGPVVNELWPIPCLVPPLAKFLVNGSHVFQPNYHIFNTNVNLSSTMP